MNVIRSIPSDGSTEINPNQLISISLTKNLNSATVNSGTVLLTNIDTNEVLRSEITLSKNTISILPSMMMDEYTSYRIDLLGTDISSAGGYIIAADGTPLSSSISISFQTSEYSATQQTIPVETTSSGSSDTTSAPDANTASITPPRVDIDSDGVSDSLQAVEDASNDLTWAYENDLYLIESTPVDGASDVALADINSSNDLILKFSRPIDEATVSSALQITQQPIAGLRFAGESEADILSRSTSTSNDLFCIDNRNLFRKPEYSYTVSNEYLQITFTDSPIKLNSEVNVDISKLLKSTEGVSGNQVFLKDHVDVDFTTNYFPMYCEIDEIRLELAELNVYATDEVISRYILINSIASWKTSCEGFEFCNPPGAAIAYVKTKTVLDIFDMSQTRNIAHPGISKSLGDFSISYKSNSRYRTPKENELADDLKGITSYLKRTYCGRKTNTWAIKGVTSSSTQRDFRTRTWRKDPICKSRANTKYERQNKLPSRTDNWS